MPDVERYAQNPTYLSFAQVFRIYSGFLTAFGMTHSKRAEDGEHFESGRARPFEAQGKREAGPYKRIAEEAHSKSRGVAPIGGPYIRPYKTR